MTLRNILMFNFKVLKYEIMGQVKARFLNGHDFLHVEKKILKQASALITHIPFREKGFIIN